jgi:lipopolysaccharide export system protein LptC
MDKLLQKAKANIEKRKQKEYDENVKEEYAALQYKSQMVKADAEMKIKIQQLHETAQKLGGRNLADAYVTHGLKNNVKEMYETRRYHPMELRRCEREVRRRVG